MGESDSELAFSGLGGPKMSGVSGMVEDFVGKIRVESQLGQGAAFIFDWPGSPVAAEAAWAAE